MRVATLEDHVLEWQGGTVGNKAATPALAEPHAILTSKDW